jgi:hypothetical protein
MTRKQETLAVLKREIQRLRKLLKPAPILATGEREPLPSRPAQDGFILLQHSWATVVPNKRFRPEYGLASVLSYYIPTTRPRSVALAKPLLGFRVRVGNITELFGCSRRDQPFVIC